MSRVLRIASMGYCQMGRRSNQEDALWPAQPGADDRLFIVCDGVGGSESGELASQSVCRHLPELLHDIVARGHDVGDKRLRRIVHDVHQCLTDEQIGDAATTMTMLYLHDRGATVAHIGDSRVYLFRKGEGRVFRTHDHSLVQQFVDNGLITEEQARNHPHSNIITMAIRPLDGEEEESVPTIDRITDLREGDVFLLCTDGVWGQLTDDELWGVLGTDEPLSERMRHMGGVTADSHDNNTAIAVEVQQIGAAPRLSWVKGVLRSLLD